MTDADVVLVIFGVTFGLTLMMYLGGRKPRRRRHVERQPGFDPEDVTELSGRLDTIATVYSVGDSIQLHRRIEHLIDSRCPVRSIAAAPAREAARIRFADGTTLLMRGQGDKLAVLAHERRRHPVHLRFRRVGSGETELVLEYRGGQLPVTLVGIDQAD